MIMNDITPAVATHTNAMYEIQAATSGQKTAKAEQKRLLYLSKGGHPRQGGRAKHYSTFLSGNFQN